MRALSPMLTRCLERANPNVAAFVEFSAPDQSRVLHRPDQFLGTGLVSMTPAASAVASPAGALTLASSAAVLINQSTPSGQFNIPQESGGEGYVNTVAWDIERGFAGCILRRVTVRVDFLQPNRPDLKLRIFRVNRQPIVITREQGTSFVQSDAVEISFEHILKEPVVKRVADLVIDGSGYADVVFDLSQFRIAVDPVASRPPSPGETAIPPAIYFSLQTLQQSEGNLVAWRTDTTSPRVIAGIGHVRELSWTRFPDNPASMWTPSESVNRALTFKLEIEAFVPTSQAVYALNLPALPSALSTGRVRFDRGAPAGSAATLELSTAGAGGPWTAVASGDAVLTQQLAYHARLTMSATADGQRAPTVEALGIEFRSLIDVSPESTIEHMSQEVAVPYLAGSIGEGSVSVVRTGRRDYQDLGGVLASSGPDTLLEADIYLGSRHPAVTRDDWFHAARAIVSNRVPTPTAERFSLLSISKTLRRKVPGLSETINAAFTVASMDVNVALDTTHIVLNEQLPGVTPLGNEYDGQGYYMQVRSTAQPFIANGATFDIAGNDGLNTLVFTGVGRPIFVLDPGDVIEVHSAQFEQSSITWFDADPADVWWELLTVHRGVDPDRVGLSAVGTTEGGGLPPSLEKRAPGDTALQDKFRVTRRLTEAQNADELIDQVSFLMGGATIEIAGQFVFRQIYPLHDETGHTTVPVDAVSIVFDARDITALETPIGRENRIPVLGCSFGVDTTIQKPASPGTMEYIDVDAFDAYGVQDLEALGSARVPDDIAAWCFNSADGGELLAKHAARQVVAACSTGVRAWSWTSIDPRPAVTVGDSVVIVTDQYTDWDPAAGVAIRGMKAYPLTIIAVSDGGRRFRGFLQGLSAIANVDVRGGRGTLLDTSTPSLSQFTYTDTETTRIYTWERSANTHAVWVYDNLVDVGTVDPYDLDASLPDVILLAGTDTYTAEKPSQGFQRMLHFVPRALDGVAGDVQHAVIDPAPSALAGTVKAVIANDTATLTLKIDGAASNWPVHVQLYEDNPDGIAIVDTIVSAPTSLTSATFAALAARPLPLSEVRRWYLKLTDVAGVMVWGIGSADRDALPWGSVTRSDYRANPSIVIAYDDDTDAVRITSPAGKVKTFSGLNGSGTVTYTVGTTAFDDATLEAVLLTDELRTPYLVELQGGGTWLTFFTGPLHGVSSKPPIGKPRVVLTTNRDLADVFVLVESPIAEQTRLFVRDSESAGAPEYGLCVGAADVTPRYVAHGTELGPTDYFAVGGVGVQKLNDISLTRDQIKRLYFRIQGKDSGISGTSDVALSAKEQPWLESISATWDDATGFLTVTTRGGANCASVLVEVDDNSSFTSPYTANAALADGGTYAPAFPLSGAERGKVWFARATPYNAAALAGLPGVAQRDEIAVPAAVTFTLEPTETGGNGTLTVVVADPGAKVHAANRVSFAKTQLGVRTLVAATTSPGGGATSGTYTYVFTLDQKHPTLIETLIHLADGSILKPGAQTFDADKTANVLNLDIVHVGTTATVKATFDTDSRATGVSTDAEYQVGAGAWTALLVNATTRLGTFNVTMTAATQTVRVRGKNAGGTAGPYVEGTIGTTGGTSPASTPGFDSVSYGLQDDATNTFQISWVPANEPAGATYNVVVWEQAHATNNKIGETTTFVGVASAYTYTTVRGWNFDLAASPQKYKMYRFHVEMISGSTVVATSKTVEYDVETDA